MNKEIKAAPVKPAGYLTTVEAADFVRLSPRTLERLRVQGTGPRYIKAGRGKRAKVLYRIADLQEWLEATTFQSTSDYR
jgi:Helix-turn-helix domain